MDLLNLLNDLLDRMHCAENDHVPRIRSVNSKIEGLNRKYMIMKKKINFWWIFSLVSVIWLLVSIVVLMFFQEQLSRLPFLGLLKDLYGGVIPVNTDLSSPAVIWLLLTVPLFLVFVITAVIMVTVLNHIRKKRAVDWWEAVGKPQTLELINTRKALASEALEMLCQNPLYERFPNSWRNTEDCRRIVNIVVKYKTPFLEDAFSIYNDILEQEYKTEQARDELRRTNEQLKQLGGQLESLRKQEERTEMMFDLWLHGL